MKNAVSKQDSDDDLILSVDKEGLIYMGEKTIEPATLEFELEVPLLWSSSWLLRGLLEAFLSDHL